MTEHPVKTVTIRNQSDVLTLIEQSMRFVPTNSLVVVPVPIHLGCARIDLGGMPAMYAEAFAPAVEHWRKADTCFLVVYGEPTPANIFLINAHELIFPGVTFVDRFFVHDGVIYDADGQFFARREPSAVEFDTQPTHDRSTFVHEARRIRSYSQAEQIALDAYRNGDGARALIYLDRARELAPLGEPLLRLAECLAHCVSPRDVEWDAEGPRPIARQA